MKGEVETYDQFLTGDVYGFQVVDSDDEVIDSCWGFYSDEGVKDAISEAKACIDGCIKGKINDHLQKLKAWIRNKVPVMYRAPLQVS